MNTITTHVLDTHRGQPGRNIKVVLQYLSSEGQWIHAGSGQTDDDGRVKNLISPDFTVTEGTYRINFEVLGYFESLNEECFYPRTSIDFLVKDASAHYHVPLLISGFGFTTYRGS